MDLVFLFLFSSGFVKGVFLGLKRSSRAFLTLFITLAIFTITIAPLSDFVSSQGILKAEFLSFLKTQTSSLSFLWDDGLNVEQTKSLLRASGLPSFVMSIFEKIANTGEQKVVMGETLANLLYSVIVLVLVAVVLFIAISFVVSIAVKLTLTKSSSCSGMFVTKRIIGGCVGGLRGLLIFVALEMILIFLAEVTGLNLINEFFLESNVASMSYEFLSKKINAFVSALIL